MADQSMRDGDKNREGAGTATGHRPMSDLGTDRDRNQSGGQSAGQSAGQSGGMMDMARNVGEQAWSAASNPVATATDLARRAGEQTYEQGARAGQYLTRNVNEYPLAALLIAGAVGYGMAYLFHSNWQSQSWNWNWSNDGSDRRDANRPDRRHDRNADRNRRD